MISRHGEDLLTSNPATVFENPGLVPDAEVPQKIKNVIRLHRGIQADSPPRVLPDARIVRLTLDTQSVTVLHLRPAYVSSVRLPEDVSSVVLGNPGTFKAEHSEAEPRLVFLKPTTTSRAETNALITTRTGHEISLHLEVQYVA
jgi:hypothetical protein